MKHYDHQPDLMVELDFTDDGLNWQSLNTTKLHSIQPNIHTPA